MQSKLCGCEEFLRHSSVELAPKNEKKPYGYHANVLSTERTITTIDALLDKESNLELLNRVFDAFTDRERSIAQDYFISEMTAEEVANRNQTSIGAIKAIIFRMRTKAKKIAKENLNFLLIVPYLLILLVASKK